MKRLFTISVAFLGCINLLSAQNITALQLMRYVGCKTNSCFNDGIINSGFTLDAKQDSPPFAAPGVYYVYSSTNNAKPLAGSLFAVAGDKASTHTIQIFEAVNEGAKLIILITSNKKLFDNILAEFNIQGAFVLKDNLAASKKFTESSYTSNKFPGYLLKKTVTNNKTDVTYQFTLYVGPTSFKMDSWDDTTPANANPVATQSPQTVTETVTATQPVQTKPAVVQTPTTTAPAVTTSDVDINIPSGAAPNDHKYALIIGNEDYSSFQTDVDSEINVDFAVNDAEVFKKYCIQTLSVPAAQIKYLKNATSAQIKQALNWINNLARMEKGNAELIFYYSGHGLPDDATKEAYLMPVDVSGMNLQDGGIKLDDVYLKLSEHPTKKVIVLLDACFSGGARNKALVAMKGSKLKPRANTLAGNMVVLSSSSNEESSGVYRNAQHGYFTYFLLKKLQETKGDVTLKELLDYVTQKVEKQSMLESRTQTPGVNISTDANPVWEGWKLK